MRSATALAALTTGALSVVMLVGPAQAAPSAPRQSSCTAARQAAQEAAAAYHAQAGDYLAQINAGGHPGMAERDHLAALKAEAAKLAALAEKECAGT